MNIPARIDRLNRLLVRQKVKLEALQGRRLIFGLATFALILASQMAKGLYLELVAILVMLPLFAIYYRASKGRQSLMVNLEDLKRFYERQKDLFEGKATGKKDVDEFANPYLARDLDWDELFPSIDQSFTRQGSLLLNEWICGLANHQNIEERQKACCELTQFSGSLRRLQMPDSQRKIDLNTLRKELQRSFFEKPIPWKWALPIFWLITFALLLTHAPSILWKTSLMIYMTGTLFYLSETRNVFSRLQDLYLDLNELMPKVRRMQSLSQNLSFCPHLKSAEPYSDMKKFTSMISLMSVKANPVIFYLLNILIPWTFLLTERSEKMRSQVSEHFEHWSKEVALIEALGSLANLAIYQDTCWPKVSNRLSFQGISHPLLDQRKVIKNDFDQGEIHKVFILTGSNMSGKSTFLRAIGINFCLAKAGGPVFAQSFAFPDLALASCICVSDSLRDGQSYFYAEVKRLKWILNEAKKSSVLFLIDEPLRGTNNQERLKGNQSYLEQMLATGSIGFMSTHDLELTKLSETDPAVENFHFSEEWKNEDLYFDYKIQSGPSTSTNALKILHKEGLY
ncbi:MAG: hypothetical protein KDD33_06580 [Bdellovibrionales bacterium]|nr:hypothetical protein [Bdellovibrionales bacterium]